MKGIDKMAYIGLDIGHGVNTWENGGGKGVERNGKVYEEHDFNSKIAIATKALLEAQGHKVTYGLQQPNSKDMPLTARTNKFNALGVDFVISMHANAGAESVDGRCVFYWHDHTNSKKLAENIVKAIHDKGYSTHGNGLHASMTGSWTNLHMVRETKMTAILIEYGFMTNAKDFEYIFGSKQNQYVKDMAEATVKGVQAYLGQSTALKAQNATVTVSNMFKKGDIVELKPTATHWIKFYEKVGGTNKGRTYISKNLKDAQFKVTYLNSDGTIELAETLNGKARYAAYERDLVKAELRL